MAPGRGVVTSRQPDSITFADGSKLDGTVAQARIQIGKLTTVRAVRFEAIQSAACTFNPQCQLAHLGALGVQGILGISPSPLEVADDLPNPLMQLSGSYGRIWTLQVGYPVTATGSGYLRLGAPPATSTTEFHLKRAGHSWSPVIRLCWGLGAGSPPVQIPTVFDSGSAATTVQSPRLTHWATPAEDLVSLPDGTAVSLSKCGQRRPVASFRSNQQLDPVFAASVQPSFATFAVASFYRFVVTYNLYNGTIGVTPSPASQSLFG